MQITNDFKKKALFSDTTEEFVSPAEPKINDTVTIRFRSVKDAIKCVSLRSKDTRYPMTKEKSVVRAKRMMPPSIICGTTSMSRMPASSTHDTMDEAKVTAGTRAVRSVSGP